MSMIAIGRLAEQSGVKVPTIRYYEGIGLLPPPRRSSGNRRLYPEAAVARLRFIRHARGLGFEIEAIRQLLGLSDHPDCPCDQADAIARSHLDEIEARIARLVAMREEVSGMISECSRHRISECRVMAVLADHRLCRHDHQ